MSSSNNVKEMVARNLRDILHPCDLLGINKSSANNSFQTQTSDHDFQTDSAAPRNLSKSIKLFVEQNLTNDIEDHLKSLSPNITKETWKIDAYNLSKALIAKPKISEVQESLYNVLDNCVKEVKDLSLRYESELGCSPLLQPGHISEIAECISLENPLDVRLSALQYLFKSHFIDAINGEGWHLLQRKLVDNLCDSNIDIFISCLKIHVKLASSSSSLAIKECSLNLIESLGQHYFLHHNDYKTINLQNIHFYRMVYLTRLLLDTFREATLNVSRFGDNKLSEMVDNFIQLMATHVPSKQSKNKLLLTPLEVVSCLDPNGTWLFNLTYFFHSRQFVFLSICKNISFMRIIVEDILNWISEPLIPSRNISKVFQGEFNFAVQKYCMFCHSLSVFSTICSFKVGMGLFPFKIAKREELLTFNDIVKMVIPLINEPKFNEMLYTKGTKTFRTLFAKHLANILCLKGINCWSLLFKLLSQNGNELLISPVTIQICENIPFCKIMSTPFIQNNIKRKFSLFSQNLVRTLHCDIYQDSGVLTKKVIEVQGTPIELENKENSPIENFLKFVTEKLRVSDLRDIVCLIKIMTHILSPIDAIQDINYTSWQSIVHRVQEQYMKCHKNINCQETPLCHNDLLLSDCFIQFLWNTAASPLGFHTLQESGIIAPLLCDGLHFPVVDWTNPVWLLYVSKSATTSEGCAVLAEEKDFIIRKELTHLWSVIDEDCSGSDIPIEDLSKELLQIIANITISLRSVKELCSESRHDSEDTLTDESDIRPSNIYGLIQYLALNSYNCPNFIHHQFALTMLNIITSNLDSSLYLQNKFKFQDVLLQMQSANCVEGSSDVIIDECSLLRHQIIDKSNCLNTLRVDTKSPHIASQPENILNQTKSRPRGTGELVRWLVETRLGLHDQNWLKHVRKLYKNSSPDDIKGSTISDLLEQVVKALPETRTAINWQNSTSDNALLPEEQLAVQLVIKYGAHHHLIQFTQQNVDNLTQLILLVKRSIKKVSDTFEGFDWFVASAYLLCSGNIEKAQSFLSLISGVPSGPLIWVCLAEPFFLAQMGNILETIIAEEMPVAFQVLQSAGLSWWSLCHTWISQCWLNILDWPHICHWFVISILHQPDYSLYFCAALLHANYDRIIMLKQQKAIYEIIMHPVDNFHLSEAKTFIEKLNKKYHNILQSCFTFN